MIQRSDPTRAYVPNVAKLWPIWQRAHDNGQHMCTKCVCKGAGGGLVGQSTYDPVPGTVEWRPFRLLQHAPAWCGMVQNPSNPVLWHAAACFNRWCLHVDYYEALKGVLGVMCHKQTSQKTTSHLQRE